MVHEIWKDIPTHVGRYQVSSLGRVRVLHKAGMRGCIWCNDHWKILAQAIGGRANNYRRVQLYHPRRFAYVHTLIAEAFIGPRPDGMMVLHKDDDGFHNTVDNIRYGDRDENEADRHVRRVAPALEAAPF